MFFFFFSSRRRHTRLTCDWSSDVCSSDLTSSWSARRWPSPARARWCSRARPTSCRRCRTRSSPSSHWRSRSPDRPQGGDHGSFTGRPPIRYCSSVGEPTTGRLPGAAAEQAPTVEDALRAALSRICVHTGWQAGRLQFSADAGDLAHRTFWHLMDPERLPSYRALAQARRDSPDVSLMARVLAHGSPLWTAIPDAAENRHAAAGTRAAVAFPVFLGTSLFALLEFFSDGEGRPEPGTVDAVSLACAELGRILQRKPADDELRRSEREY